MQAKWLQFEEDYCEFFGNESPNWLNRYTRDPIATDSNGLYFFSDEVWRDMYGPFETLEQFIVNSCRR